MSFSSFFIVSRIKMPHYLVNYVKQRRKEHNVGPLQSFLYNYKTCVSTNVYSMYRLTKEQQSVSGLVDIFVLPQLGVNDLVLSLLFLQYLISASPKAAHLDTAQEK